MHWPSVLASANPLRKGQRLVRPSREDAGRHLCGLRNGVFEVSRTKPGAQLEPFKAETEHGHRLSAYPDDDARREPSTSVRSLIYALVGIPEEKVRYQTSEIAEIASRMAIRPFNALREATGEQNRV